MLSDEQIKDIQDTYQQVLDDIWINYCTVEYGIDIETATEGYNNVKDAFVKDLLEAQEQATAREIIEFIKEYGFDDEDRGLICPMSLRQSLKERYGIG